MFAPPTAVESQPALEIRGETACPRPPEVAVALGRMLGGAAAAGSGDVAELSEDDTSFVIVVRRASGEIVGEKRLPASLACSVRAQMAAVAIAALEGQLAGDDEAGALPVPPPRDPEVAPPPPARAPAPPASVTRAGPPAAAPLGVEVGLGALASPGGEGVAPGGRVEVVVHRAQRPWSLGLAGLVLGTEQMAVGAGAGRWWRWGAELSVLRELGSWPDARVEARLAASLTAVEVAGGSFSTNGRDRLLDPGAAVALRLVVPTAGVRPWLELGGTVWPQAHELSVSDRAGNVVATAALPKGQFFISAGVSFGGRR